MYLAGFYSPKEKKGVTELSLSVYHWLKKNTTLSVAFIAYGTLEKEEMSLELIHGFSQWTVSEQKRQVRKMKRKYDIIIYDASSQLSEGVLKLLPIVDRLFVVGEENNEFALKIHQIIQFDKIFDNRVKNFITHLQGNKTFVLRESKGDRVMGFHYKKEETNHIGEMVYTDYVTCYLEKTLIERHVKIFEQIKKIPREELYRGLYELGIDFEKGLLFHKFVQHREALGQTYEEAIEKLFPVFINSTFAELLQKLDSEIYFITKLNKQIPS
ncbi:hypothetical protein [Bacillus benzoevorans]|uniref:Uncharacterized protein n=1 Tax=Bacillus benzoevorans TaxID=1456 RepID=A0A7X0HNG6_9BACI|nr:hypothetical protein [Bacillus benzoevorans]MBB6444004.1 hypothetical protein [Bacillus benzoevorans]